MTQQTKTVKTLHVNSTAQDKDNWWWKFIAYSIPAYTYFFGYVSESYYLEGLGFDEAEVSGEPGSVYRFAFNSFFFLNGAALKTAWPKYVDLLSDTWWHTVLTALGGGALLYGFVKAIDYWNLKREKKQNLDRQNGKEDKPHFLFSIFISLATAILHIGSVPLIIGGMTFISAVFIPAPLTGLAMAEKEISEFTCTLSENSKAPFESCTTLKLSNQREIIGNIKHRDAEYTYVYTDAGPQAVPTQLIEQRIRYKVHKPAVARRLHKPTPMCLGWSTNNTGWIDNEPLIIPLRRATPASYDE